METNIISKAFKMARNAGLVSTQQDFAKLVGANPATISRAIANDSEYLTDKLIFRVEKILAERGVFINGENSGVVQTGDNNQTIPGSTALAEITAARQMYDKHLSMVLEQNSQLLQQNSQLIQIIARHEH